MQQFTYSVSSLQCLWPTQCWSSSSMCACVCMGVHTHMCLWCVWEHVCMCTYTHANGGQRTISVLSTFAELFCFILLSWGRISLWPGTSQSRFNWLTTEPQECIWLCVPNTRITSIHCHAQLLFTWVLGIKPRFTQALHWLSCIPGPWIYSNEHIPTRAEVVFEIDPVKYI